MFNMLFQQITVTKIVNILIDILEDSESFRRSHLDGSSYI